MVQCAIAKCKNNQRSDKTISFHHFPQKDKSVTKTWVEKCKRLDRVNLRNARVCSAHFTSDDYEIDLRNELMGWKVPRKLKSDAIPSKNLPTADTSEDSGTSRAQKRKNRILVRSLTTDNLRENQMKRVDVNSCTGTTMDKQKLVKPKKPPTTAVMVMQAVQGLNKKGGTSLHAIKKYITEVHKVDTEKKAYIIRRALTMAVADGKLVQMKGSGAHGTFKLPQPPKAAKSKESGTGRKCTLPLDGGTDGATHVLRVMIIRALEFHTPDQKVDPDVGVTYELINSYVQETFDMKTDCLKVLNEMVQEGILTQSLDGKYSKRNLSKVERVDEDKEDFNGLMRDVLTTTDASSVLASGTLALPLPSTVPVKIDDSKKSMLTVETRNGEKTENIREEGEGFQYECGFCNSTFSSFDLRSEHTNEVHSHIKEFRCKYCGRLFRSKLTLYMHFGIHSKNKNGVEKPYKCSVCNGGFNEKVLLAKHIEWFHEDKKRKYQKRRAQPKFECGICGLTFSSMVWLNKHMKGNHKPSQPDRTITFKEEEMEVKVPFLQPELVGIVKSEPEEFVFVNYLDNLPLDNDLTSMSCTQGSY